MIIKAIIKQVLLSKTGNRPFASVSVQFDEYTDGGKRVWIRGFGNKRTWAWKVGDDVQPKVEPDGKYWNFTFDDTDENRLDVYSLPATVGLVMDLLKLKTERSAPRATGGASPAPATSTEGDTPNTDDIPF